MQKCFIEKLNYAKSIYHLGGFGLEWLYELSVVPRGFTDGIFTCGVLSLGSKP